MLRSAGRAIRPYGPYLPESACRKQMPPLEEEEGFAMSEATGNPSPAFDPEDFIVEGDMPRDELIRLMGRSVHHASSRIRITARAGAAPWPLLSKPLEIGFLTYFALSITEPNTLD